jgi:hypothetical protein
MGHRSELCVRQRLLAHGRVLRLFSARRRRPNESNGVAAREPALPKQRILQPTNTVWFYRVSVVSHEEASRSSRLSRVCGQRPSPAHQYPSGTWLSAVAISNPLWQTRLRFHSKLDLEGGLQLLQLRRRQYADRPHASARLPRECLHSRDSLRFLAFKCTHHSVHINSKENLHAEKP